jgi:hypothetical protein
VADCTIGASSSSCSTDRSQSVTWSSAPDAANTDVSDVCHSTEVMGALCHEKSATGVAFLSSQYLPLHIGGTAYCLNILRSQTLSPPSSPPLSSK